MGMRSIVSGGRGGIFQSGDVSFGTAIKKLMGKKKVAVTSILSEWGKVGKQQSQMRTPELTGELAMSIKYRARKDRNKVYFGVSTSYADKRGGNSNKDVAYLVHEFWDELINPLSKSPNSAKVRAARKTSRTGKRVGSWFLIRAVTEERKLYKDIAIKGFQALTKKN